MDWHRSGARCRRRCGWRPRPRRPTWPCSRWSLSAPRRPDEAAARSRCWAARRSAGRADPMGAGARSREPLCTAGPALHRTDARAHADRRVVRAALDHRGHIPGSARPSWGRDAAAVVRHGDRPHHALPARPVLDRHTAGRTPLGSPTATRRGRRVVPQTAPDLRRCTGRRALCDLARADFGNITAPTRPNKTPLPFASALGLCALPRRMNGQRYHAGSWRLDHSPVF